MFFVVGLVLFLPFTLVRQDPTKIEYTKRKIVHAQVFVCVCVSLSHLLWPIVRTMRHSHTRNKRVTGGAPIPRMIDFILEFLRCDVCACVFFRTERERERGTKAHMRARPGKEERDQIKAIRTVGGDFSTKATFAFALLFFFLFLVGWDRRKNRN